MNKIIPSGYNEAAQYLESYKGSFAFLQKLQKVFNKYGNLSSNQWNAIVKCINSEKSRNQANAPGKAPIAVNCNTNIVLSRFIAQRVAKDNNMSIAPFTYIVKNVLFETAKAVKVTMEANYSNVSVCICCGKDLTDWRSQATGMGKHCAEKLGITYIKDQNDVYRFKLEIAKKFAALGEITTVLPKSQIKEGLDNLMQLCNKTIAPTPVTQPTNTAAIPVLNTPTQTKPAVTAIIPSLLTTKQLIYDEVANTLVINLSEAGNDFKIRNTLMVVNTETTNTVKFKLDDIATDGAGNNLSWHYVGEFNKKAINLVINNC